MATGTRIAALLVVAVLVMLAVPAVRHLREQPPPPPPAIRLSLSVPSGVEPGWGDNTLDAAISPDESRIAFVATSGGVTQLWLRSLDEERAEPIPGTDGARLPAWKQTGNVVSFFSGERLKQITLADGGAHDLADAPSPAGATWLADGSVLFATGSGPIRRLRDGRVTDATTLAAGDFTHVSPVAAGASDDFVYVAVRTDGRRVARLVSDRQERDLTTTSGHAALVGRFLLHVRDGVLLAYERDGETGALAPHGVPLGLEVGVSAAGHALFAASPRFLLHAPSAPRAQELAWLDASGTRVGTIGDAGDYWQVRLSPDDRSAAVTAVDPLLRGLDVVIFPTAGAGDAVRLTLALAADTDPVWSPDGVRVLFRSMEGGTPNLFAKQVGRSDATSERVFESASDKTPTDWIRRGTAEEILFHAREERGTQDIWILDPRTGVREPLARGGFNETDARFSPDGRWIAYVSDESGRPDVYAVSNGMRIRVSFAGGTRPRWTRDGMSILFLRGSQVMRADLVPGDPARFTSARLLFDAPAIRDFDVAHRSDRLLALLPVKAGTRPTISAVLNWSSLAGAPRAVSGR